MHNAEGVWTAVKQAWDEYDPQKVVRAVESLLVVCEKIIEFKGLLEGKPLVDEMADADALLVFSNYENFPVVINESFVLGIPVIATRVGGVPEFVNAGNGTLIDAGDEQALEQNLIDFLDNKLQFNNAQIKESSKKAFSPETIGQALFDIYQKLIN